MKTMYWSGCEFVIAKNETQAWGMLESYYQRQGLGDSITEVNLCHIDDGHTLEVITKDDAWKIPVKDMIEYEPEGVLNDKYQHVWLEEF